MAQVIGSDQLGTDQNNQGQTTNAVTQPGQQTNTSTANQAGQAPVQSQSGAAPTTSNNSSPQGGQSTGANNTPSAGSNQTTAGGNSVYNPNKQQGSGYVNIQKVINANQGNQLGSAVGNNLQQTETSAQQNLQNAQNQFQQQTSQNQANTQANQQLAQNVLANPTQYVAQGTNTPSAANAQNASQFQNLISGQYQGPTSLTNASNLQNQASNIAQQGQALGTSGGRIGLLQQIVGNPNYTSGDASLDSLLLGQSNSPALQQAKQQALTLTGQTNNAVAGAAAQGQQQQAQASQFGQALQGQLANNITSQTNALQAQATAAQNANNTQYQQALTDLQSGNVTPAEAQALGLTQGENVYNLLNGAGQGSAGASAFLSQNANQANVANTANAQQYAQMQALQQLGGQYLSQPAQTALQNFQSPSQAGTYANQQNLIGNQSAFNTALAADQSNYNSIYQPAQASDQQAQQINSIWQQVQNGSLNPVTAESQIAAFAPGALGGTPLQNAQWASGNLATQNANLAAAQNQLNTQYGTQAQDTINIAPSAYPGLAGVNS